MADYLFAEAPGTITTTGGPYYPDMHILAESVASQVSIDSYGYVATPSVVPIDTNLAIGDGLTHLGFFGVAPVPVPVVSPSTPAFLANTPGTAVTITSTYGGYTVGTWISLLDSVLTGLADLGLMEVTLSALGERRAVARRTIPRKIRVSGRPAPASPAVAPAVRVAPRTAVPRQRPAAATPSTD